jgi:hypothetical protein
MTSSACSFGTIACFADSITIFAFSIVLIFSFWATWDALAIVKNLIQNWVCVAWNTMSLWRSSTAFTWHMTRNTLLNIWFNLRNWSDRRQRVVVILSTRCNIVLVVSSMTTTNTHIWRSHVIPIYAFGALIYTRPETLSTVTWTKITSHSRVFSISRNWTACSIVAIAIVDKFSIFAWQAVVWQIVTACLASCTAHVALQS